MSGVIATAEPTVHEVSDLPLRLVHDLGSNKLRRRRFEALPLRGPGAAHTAPQGREPGDATAPVELSDLISSIAEIGLLQPILVEEIGSEEAPTRRLVVAGERRLRACRWGAAHLPDNPHFHEIPAVICPGPLSEEERRIWQLIENLAREPLRPGEQAAALLLQRCAILTGKLLRAGKPVPAEVYDLVDPVERFAALERIRSGDPAAAAPWSEVLDRLGLQLTPRKARELVRAFAALPRHLSEEMDEQKITLHTRIRFARLMHGREKAAEEIWAAVKQQRRPDLLPGAIGVSEQDPALPAGHVIGQAAERQAAANQARADKLSGHRPGATPAAAELSGPGGTEHLRSDAGDRAVPPGHLEDGQQIPSELARGVLDGLRLLAAELRRGARLSRYDAGSLDLVLTEVTTLIKNGAPV